MTLADDRALEELLYGGHLGDQVEGEEPVFAASAPAVQENSSTDNTLTAVSIQEPIICGGCGEQVCERFFLLAAGRVWHNMCLRCSQCQCELQTHPSLFWREGNIYCLLDYCRLFGGGQCVRCLQPIPASALVMRSGELTFHPHCFSCQECDVALTPGSYYCVQGQNLYCQSHYHGNGGTALSHQAPLLPDPQEVHNEGEESVSSPEPRLEEGSAGGRARRRTKRIRTCFRSEQLRALESYFAQKHNPDGKDWSGLAHRTGLPKRVLQVWFQNARAKLRRSLSTDDSQASSPSAAPRAITTATGTPPLAHSPADQAALPFPASTIDHRQLSLITAPLSPPSAAAHDSPFYLDYDSHNAPGLSPALEHVYADAGEGVEANTQGLFRAVF